MSASESRIFLDFRLFVARHFTYWVVLVRPKIWERYGLKPWIESAKKRMHHNVLAIALANKLARIAWAVLNKERNFECTKTNAMEPRPA